MKDEKDRGASPLAAVDNDTTVVHADQLSRADQALWDAAWALHDPHPSGQQWRRSNALKDAIDALIAAVRADVRGDL